MKVINKIINKNIGDSNWDYYEIIQYNNSGYERYNILNKKYKHNWIKYNMGTSMYVIINEKEIQILENIYQKLMRKEKLERILDDNY